MLEQSRNAIEKLHLAFKEKKISLYLGAGVSIGSNLPAWDKLVLAMYFSTMSEQYLGGWRPFSNYLYAIAEWQLANNPEPLEITARKLRKYYSPENDEQIFRDNLYQTLYGSLIDREGNPLPDINRDFLRQNNLTLNAVARLCESDQRGVHTVISYNYDNILEIALGNFNFQSVYSSNSLVSGKLPIYHVHGFVPLDRNEPGSKGTDIVFTEDQYHRVAGNPYFWSNLVQLQAMANSVGLMIGLSLSDRNMRRLLDAVQNAPVQSGNYALLKIPDETPPDNQILDEIHEKAIKYLEKFEKSGIKWDDEARDSVFFAKPGVKSARSVILSPRMGEKGPLYRHEIAGIMEQVQKVNREQQDYVLKQLGVTPIWFNNYSDIQAIIDMILA